MTCLSKYEHIFKIQIFQLLQLYGQIYQYTFDTPIFYEICESSVIT